MAFQIFISFLRKKKKDSSLAPLQSPKIIRMHFKTFSNSLKNKEKFIFPDTKDNIKKMIGGNEERTN